MPILNLNCNIGYGKYICVSQLCLVLFLFSISLFNQSVPLFSFSCHNQLLYHVYSFNRYRTPDLKRSMAQAEQFIALARAWLPLSRNIFTNNSCYLGLHCLIQCCDDLVLRFGHSSITATQTVCFYFCYGASAGGVLCQPHCEAARGPEVQRFTTSTECLRSKPQPG